MSKSHRRPAPIPVRKSLRSIGTHIETWRKLRGLTQAQLADRAGVTRGTVVRLEKGEGTVSIDITLRVLHALGVLDAVAEAIDPYDTDIGRLRADEQLPKRVRPRNLRLSHG